MNPFLVTGQLVFITHSSFKEGSIVLVKTDEREVIKRVDSIKNDMVYLVGDNHFNSTDSRHYGPVHKSAILGTVMIVFPRAINPPKLVKPYGIWLGRITAGVLVVIALVHMFRIDTFVPILDGLLPGGQAIASFITVAIIFSEIFAVPFALRIRLSPFAHVLSGAFVILAPIYWLLLSAWAYNSGQPVGQLGEFFPIYSTIMLIVVNTLWAAFSYYTIYMLGYFRLIRK